MSYGVRVQVSSLAPKSLFSYKKISFFTILSGILKENYHVVLPVLDGHADSDTPFTTIENNAKELINYIDRNFHGTIFTIGGLSLGGQILVEMLSQRSDICKYAVIESALVVP
ncbi:MAG: alpha/beta hydrolase, partial [Oscillospiraceae bacterium]